MRPPALTVRASASLSINVVAAWRTRAVTRSDTHVVEQVAITGEGRGPRHAGAELQAVDGRGRIAVRRWCLLRSGAVVVLPRREALTKVTAVDRDSHQVVVNARVDLDPEPDPVRTAAAKQRARVRDELAIDVGGVVDADPNTVRGVFQAHPGHARALARVRADAQEQSGLVGGRRGHKRELGEEHLIEPLPRRPVVAPVGNTSGWRTHQTHMRSTYATIDCRTQEARQEERQCWRRPPGRTVRWLGLGHTPGSPQGERSSRGSRRRRSVR